MPLESFDIPSNLDDRPCLKCEGHPTLSDKYFVNICSGSWSGMKLVINVNIHENSYIRQALKSKKPLNKPDRIKIEFLDINFDDIGNNGSELVFLDEESGDGEAINIKEYGFGYRIPLLGPKPADTVTPEQQRDHPYKLNIFVQNTNKTYSLNKNFYINNFGLRIDSNQLKQDQQNANFSFTSQFLTIGGSDIRANKSVKIPIADIFYPPIGYNPNPNAGLEQDSNMWLNKDNAIREANKFHLGFDEEGNLISGGESIVKTRYNAGDIIYIQDGVTAGDSLCNRIYFFIATRNLPNGVTDKDNDLLLPKWRLNYDEAFWRPVILKNLPINKFGLDDFFRTYGNGQPSDGAKYIFNDIDDNDNKLCQFLSKIKPSEGDYAPNVPVGGETLIVPTVRASFIANKNYITEKDVLDSSIYDSDDLSRTERAYYEPGTFTITYDNPEDSQPTLTISITIGHLNKDILVGDKYLYARLKNKIDFADLRDSITSVLIDYNPKEDLMTDILKRSGKLSYIVTTSTKDLQKEAARTPDEEYIYSSYFKITDDSFISLREFDTASELLGKDREGIVCFDDTDPLTMEKNPEIGANYLEPKGSIKKCYRYKNGTFFDTALGPNAQPIHELIFDPPNSHDIKNTISNQNVGTCGGTTLIPEEFPPLISGKIDLYAIEFHYIEYDANNKFYNRKFVGKFDFPFILSQKPEEIQFDTIEQYSQYLSTNSASDKTYDALIQRLIKRFGLVKESHTYDSVPNRKSISITEVDRQFWKGEKIAPRIRYWGPRTLGQDPDLFPEYDREKDTNLPCYSKIKERIEELKLEISQFDSYYLSTFIQPFKSYRNYLYREQEVRDKNNNIITTYISRLQYKPFMWCDGRINLGLIFGPEVSNEEASFNIKTYGYKPSDKTVYVRKLGLQLKAGFVYHGIVQFTDINGDVTEIAKNLGSQYGRIDDNISIHEVIGILINKDFKDGPLPETVLKFIKQLEPGIYAGYLRNEDITGIVTNLPKTIKGLDKYKENKKELLLLEGNEARKILGIVEDGRKYRLTCGDGPLGRGK